MVIAKGQLRGKGIAGFQIQRGQTTFFAATSAEVRAAKSTRRGSTLYVISDPAATAGKRMMKAIPEQGLPVPSNPMLLGNLFLMLDVEFPTELGEAAVAALKGALPPPLNVPSVTEEDEGVEVHHMETMDPVASFKATDIPDESQGGDDDEGGEGGQRVQCA